MNVLHRWYCRSGGWGKLLEERIIPWTLEGVELGEEALEIGPGPGLTTDVLRTLTPKLTSIEIDHSLAEGLRARLEETGVTVVEGDATAMPFPDASFSGAACFTMLHHVPTPELQDRLISETHRVLRPGGVFAGTDSLTSWRWRLYHLFDTCVPVDPDRMGERLERAGFRQVAVDSNPWAFRFQGRKKG